jgi:hypothetical protein
MCSHPLAVSSYHHYDDSEIRIRTARPCILGPLTAQYRQCVQQYSGVNHEVKK